jgi:hypothetical protein
MTTLSQSDPAALVASPERFAALSSLPSDAGGPVFAAGKSTRVEYQEH